MRSVIISMGISRDGHIVEPDGSFDCTASEGETSLFITGEIGEVGLHLLGGPL